jgi:predicted hydrolase (HD superfamily)
VDKEPLKKEAYGLEDIVMTNTLPHAAALELLLKYNKEPFHILHGLTMGGVMHWYAEELGFGSEADYWGMVGLLHDIDFEMYPEEHCIKAPELLRAANISEEMIRSICSHGYGICVDIKPEHLMEKVLFAVDELTGLIGATIKMRPSKSVMDLETSSLKKKFKDKKFAAGCSREVIKKGADLLGWSLDELFAKTIMAMQSCEKRVQSMMQDLNQAWG